MGGGESVLVIGVDWFVGDVFILLNTAVVRLLTFLMVRRDRLVSMIFWRSAMMMCY